MASTGSDSPFNAWWLTQNHHSTSSQKPNEELYAAFKHSFPDVGPPSHPVAHSTDAPSHGIAAIGSIHPDPSLESELDDHGDGKEHDLTSRGNEQWRLTPSLMDANSFSFASLANHQPGYYTPIPGGMNTVYHNHTAGDLHTPGMAFQLGTPLSMPMPEGSLQAVPPFDMSGFSPQVFQSQSFQNQNQNPFAMQQETYAPSMLVHKDSGYGPMEGSPVDDVDVATDLNRDLNADPQELQRVGGTMSAPPLPPVEKFRYQVTLNAPTAMIRHADEIPVTYLNKGQAYTVSIVDSTPLAPSLGPVKYRTVIRISFEDDRQRQRPSACWQLWKEGRGLAESHVRGGRLQAVEFVDPHPGSEDDPRRPRIELENASFDCFSVIWSPPIATGTADCSLAVRFNFLSTDFSHSKGVKGIPVRLCAKTEIASSSTPDSPSGTSEVCFCKVKLFRDHGAERKLSNDVAHVKKTINKLKQQIAQMESGAKDSGKRKRTASMAGKVGGERPAKLVKRKRTWSFSSQGSSGRPAAEEDLHQKLVTVQDMFTSTRPVSVLYLKGAEEDDPDLFPVSLPGNSQDLNIDTGKQWEREPKRSGELSETGSSMTSPIPSSVSMPDKTRLRRSSTFKLSRQISHDWPLSATMPDADYSMAYESNTPVKVQRQSHGGELPDWIDAVGIDPSYVPPPERPVKPVACFYAQIRTSNLNVQDNYYRAVYLMQRTVGELIGSIATRYDINPARIHRSLRINDKGLRIWLDEELVREIPEGQDMIVEIGEFGQDGAVKLESLQSVSANSSPMEMRLIF